MAVWHPQFVTGAAEGLFGSSADVEAAWPSTPAVQPVLRSSRQHHIIQFLARGESDGSVALRPLDMRRLAPSIEVIPWQHRQ
ncbi:hypothetical protein OEZ86_004286 [Tetradesmus obliquus]|nr:hypothetical protein OEZ86_004286 [Tetradesmus obliquus]